jgi:hypothetical protein
MRKWSLITAILLALSAWVVGQSTSQQPDAQHQQPDAQQQKEPMGANQPAQTIEGCITKAATGYILTDNAGKTYQLAGDTSQLAAEDGHWDRVSGSEESHAPGTPAAAGAPTTFTVTKVRVVQTTCPTK